MNFTGPPAARAGAQYAPGVDLRPACVHTCLAEYLRLHKNCFVLQRYTIKTAFPSRIYQRYFIIFVVTQTNGIGFAFCRMDYSD